MVKILAILPLLKFFFYVAVIVFIIWFVVWIFQSQKERNILLKEISNKLDYLENFKKGD
ncbi:hypothetical protein SAMN05518871_103445 [Psychrobacillus sp. OK028]|uniref:hypothetical protein n=1 Tax=Psychrobacillus sp. OK028 TaxID=1884359 RepID=UPI00088F82C3|nr:hypothetical protein [Psychrobacillus sp. OK028]SDN15265.1 hypothetical protein SAMN05518871_103445 [Psychrobacillus sp. OK028]